MLAAVVVYAFLASSFSPEQCIDGQYDIAVGCEVIARILAVVATCRPVVGICQHFRLNMKRAYHFLLADGEMGSMVVKHDDGGERTFTVGHQ